MLTHVVQVVPRRREQISRDVPEQAVIVVVALQLSRVHDADVRHVVSDDVVLLLVVGEPRAQHVLRSEIT